jgi:hypothetical protein
MAATKKKIRTPALPARVVELTLVGSFPRPKEWKGRGTPAGDAEEIRLMEAEAWHPCTEDFQQVANVPNTNGKLTTVFKPMKSIGDVLGAILDLGSDGGEPRRAPGTIKRLNLISHGLGESGRQPLYGLSGTIAADGGCFLDGSKHEGGDPNRPMASPGIDEGLIEWLNTSAAGLRDQCRERFRADGEIALIMCNSGASTAAMNVGNLAMQLARTFQVPVLTFGDRVVYHNVFLNGRITTRNRTSVGKYGEQGLGYECAVSVPAELAGKHLKFSKPVPP